MSRIRPALSPDSVISDGLKGPSPSPAWGQRVLDQTPSLRELVEPITQAILGDMTTLLTGETGTGKTRLARVIHDHSRRKDQRLLVVSCGALSPRKLASELFGHVRGAFPGADRDQPGKMGAAGQGTILLDEVDALALEQQTQLLRILETGEYEPVGATQTRQCQARVIASSKRDLEEAVLRGQFRQDLYYRLRVLTLHLPPLRERPEDIDPLVRSMMGQFGKELGKGLTSLSMTTLTALQTFPWPGNIRQLRHVVQQAMLACTGPELLTQHLPLPVREWAASTREPVTRPAAKGFLSRNSSLRP
jgi:DNA-binding NtrC family response regulator